MVMIPRYDVFIRFKNHSTFLAVKAKITEISSTRKYVLGFEIQARVHISRIQQRKGNIKQYFCILFNFTVNI